MTWISRTYLHAESSTIGLHSCVSCIVAQSLPQINLYRLESRPILFTSKPHSTDQGSAKGLHSIESVISIDFMQMLVEMFILSHAELLEVSLDVPCSMAKASQYSGGVGFENLQDDKIKRLEHSMYNAGNVFKQVLQAEAYEIIYAQNSPTPS